MRNILLIFLLGIFSTSCAQNQEESSAQNIKRFYHYYIVEMDKTLPQIKFNEDSLQKYCTTSFLKGWYDGNEYDRVLQAQDYYIGWAENITVMPTGNTENNEYSVCFLGEQKHCIIVTVKKEQGKYKIFNTKLDTTSVH